MKTPQIKPSWNFGIYIGNGIVASNKNEEWNPWEKIDKMIQEEMQSEEEFCERLQDELKENNYEN